MGSFELTCSLLSWTWIDRSSFDSFRQRGTKEVFGWTIIQSPATHTLETSITCTNVKLPLVWLYYYRVTLLAFLYGRDPLVNPKLYIICYLDLCCRSSIETQPR
jgi:hypothetical protein